jgi:hypothetical protein
MKIVSGGQTGVDRGALDAAIELAIPHGGWCPRGRLAEDGPIPEQYGLFETDSSDYPSRTQRNVVESDATLILFRGRIAGGTELTFRLAESHQRPRLAVDLDAAADPARVRRWLAEQRVEVLNVAGPRESQNPGIGALARAFLLEVFRG